jgi:transposase-like protein
LIAVIDGLKGFPEAITTAFPQTIVQTCIVHLIRNSLAFVSWFGFYPLPRFEAVAQQTDEKARNCNHTTIMHRVAANRESKRWSFRKRQPSSMHCR